MRKLLLLIPFLLSPIFIFSMDCAKQKGQHVMVVDNEDVSAEELSVNPYVMGSLESPLAYLVVCFKKKKYFSFKRELLRGNASKETLTLLLAASIVKRDKKAFRLILKNTNAQLSWLHYQMVERIPIDFLE